MSVRPLSMHSSTSASYASLHRGGSNEGGGNYGTITSSSSVPGPVDMNHPSMGGAGANGFGAHAHAAAPRSVSNGSSSQGSSTPSSMWTPDESLLARTILINGLSPEATVPSIRMLFGSLGRIESLLFTPAGEVPGLPSGHASIVYATPDEANAALRLHGCFGWGAKMEIKPAAMTVGPSQRLTNGAPHSRSPLPFGPHSARQTDSSGPSAIEAGPGPAAAARTRGQSDSGSPSHKNLYVLNLPLDATTDQLAALFSSYGSVVHCVILAMLDAQARRRGFIDMTSPAEAKAAIEGLNGFVWKGYPIEVSYAIVQRSGGPFDSSSAGRNVIKRNVPRNRFNTGPRRMPGDHSPFGSVDFAQGGFNHQNGFASHHSMNGGTPPTPVGSDPRTLFISGLDPVAVLDDDDFRRILEPYGTISAISLSRDERGISRGFGIVTFSHEPDAHRARVAMDGKIVNGRRLTARVLVSAAAMPPAMDTLPPARHIADGIPAPYQAYVPSPSSLPYGSHHIGGGFDEQRSRPYDMPTYDNGYQLHSRPDFGRANSTPYDASQHQLEEAFQQKAFGATARTPSRTEPVDRSYRGSTGSVASFSTVASGNASGNDWRSRLNSVNTEQHSPASTLSLSSASSSLHSEIQTPDTSAMNHNKVALGGGDSVWAFPRRSGAASPFWSRSDQSDAGQPASAMNNLRRDSPPLQADDLDPTRRAGLAPVGHEKGALPVRLGNLNLND